MKFSEATPSRSLILRLENGEILHDVVEKPALDHNPELGPYSEKEVFD